MKNIKEIHNQAIKAAYFQIIQQAKQLISNLEEEPLRGILMRQDEPISTGGCIIDELINTLIYLRLKAYKDDAFAIHYGYEQNDLYTKYYPVTSAFIRSVYYCTAKENTHVNVGDCVHTDWVVTNCAELFEYIGDRNKFHKYKTLVYQNSASRQNLIIKQATDLKEA